MGDKKMATIIIKGNTTDWPEEDPRIRAYRALATAASRIGRANYHAELQVWVKGGKSAKTYRYTPSAAHRLVVEAMPHVLDGRISVDAAMSLLWEYDVMQERLAE